MLICIDRYLEQMRDGEQYQGTLKIGDVLFRYTLVFAVPILVLQEMDLGTKSPEEIDRLFDIIVMREDTSIVLTREERQFFLNLTLLHAIEFHNNPQMRANNEGLRAMVGIGLVNTPAISVSLGMTDSNFYDLTVELCQMLSAPKFGCVLTS